MRQAERVSSLVRGQLTSACQHHCEHGVIGGRRRLAVYVRRKQGFGNQIVLARAQRSESDVPLDDFASARIDHRTAIAPAARVSMHPLNDVVANIHGVCVGRQQIDTEGTPRPTRSLKRLVPPARAFHQGGTDSVGCATVHIVLNRRLCFAVAYASGFFLLQPVTDDELLIEGFTQWRRIITICVRKVARAWIEAPRRETRTGKLDERLMLANRDGMRVGSYLAHEIGFAGIV